jgi:hypothetical protein
MKSGEIPVSRKHDIVVQEIETEVLIYDLAKNKAFCLNQTSAMVWNACDGTKSVTEISQTLSRQLKTHISEDIVWLALNQLKKDDLLAESNNFVTPFDGMNRREIVKRIGFASMVAIPLISSVIAPTALNAQSGAVVACGCNGNNNAFSNDGGCACNSNNDCCSNVCGAGGTICSAGPPAGQAASCCVAIICPPANQNNIPPGCLCNVGGPGTCASGTCANGICAA